MAKSQKEKNAMEQLKIASESKKRSNPKGKPANWATRLKAKLKVEFAKRAQKKAYKNLSAAEKRENFKTERTKRTESALRKAGISEEKIQRLRGRRN